MAKKTKAAKDAAETVLKKAQKKADELVAAAQDAADAAKKSAKKAKKSAKTADKSAKTADKSAKTAGKSSKAAEKSSKSVESVGAPALTAPEPESAPVIEPSTEDAPAAESLPLPTADDPDVPSEAWTVARLRAAAKERGVVGIGTMRKDQLIAALTSDG